MAELQTKSFSQVTLVEAVARQASVHLVVPPIRLGSVTRLRSRFLTLEGGGDLVLSAPVTQSGGRKVFLPIGWALQMSFPVGGFTLRAAARVLGHCQHAWHPTHRIDALIVERPIKVVATDSRKHPREEFPPSSGIAASVWPAADLAAGRSAAPQRGTLANRSRAGLGIRFDGQVPGAIGTEMIIRLEDRRAELCGIYRAVLKHCSPAGGGKWLAGFGTLVELGPGEAVPIMESLILPRP